MREKRIEGERGDGIVRVLSPDLGGGELLGEISSSLSTYQIPFSSFLCAHNY